MAFNETASTMGVNHHGAKISTAYRLSVGDQITVGNPVLGQSAQARVARIAEKGSAFEIGVELLEPQDVWGPEIPPEGGMEDSDVGGESRSSEGSSTPERDAAPQLTGEGTVETSAGPAATSVEQPIETTGGADTQSPADLRESAQQAAGGGKLSSPPETRLESLDHFLRASRAELEGLLARTQEIQRLSSQAVHSLLEQLHRRLQQELEASSTGFVSDTRQRVQDTASAALEVFGKQANALQAALLDEALARWQAARQDIELKLREASDDHQKKLAESSASALEEFRGQGKSLFDGYQTELQKNVEDLQKRGAEDVSEHLRRTAGELTDEIRRRADAGFETLSGELTSSGKTLVDETQKQLATLSQSALDALTKEASETVRQQVGLGISALNQAADQTRANLESDLQQAIESFQKQIGELTSAALEKNSKTSEFLLHDLRSRLDQAARALQQTLEAEAGGRERFAG